MVAAWDQPLPPDWPAPSKPCLTEGEDPRGHRQPRTRTRGAGCGWRVGLRERRVAAQGWLEESGGCGVYRRHHCPRKNTPSLEDLTSSPLCLPRCGAAWKPGEGCRCRWRDWRCHNSSHHGWIVRPRSGKAGSGFVACQSGHSERALRCLGSQPVACASRQT
jgi:hypothetical protein